MPDFAAAAIAAAISYSMRAHLDGRNLVQSISKEQFFL